MPSNWQRPEPTLLSSLADVFGVREVDLMKKFSENHNIISSTVRILAENPQQAIFILLLSLLIEAAQSFKKGHEDQVIPMIKDLIDTLGPRIVSVFGPKS